MKRIFFKSGFSAIAFILAIVISFAFASASDSKDVTSNAEYVQLFGSTACQEVETDCVYGNTFNCTTWYDFQIIPVYNLNYDETLCFESH